MNRKAIAFFELIRLPNVVTAAADSLAGWLLVGGSLANPKSWLPLTLASVILYASGTALNDVFDIAIDRQERPARPLPSGRISRSAAAWLGGAGLVAGPILAVASGSFTSGLVAAALAVCILCYNAGLKHTWAGPGFMGACRGLNLLLGMSHAARLAGPIGWATAALYGLFVAGITVVSRSEVKGGGRLSLLAGLALQNLAILGLAGVALSHQQFPLARSDQPLLPLEGLLALGLVALALDFRGARAVDEPSPGHIIRTVKTGILSLVWLHFGVVVAVRGLGPAALLAVFWAVALILGRWLYST